MADRFGDDREVELAFKQGLHRSNRAFDRKVDTSIAGCRRRNTSMSGGSQ